MSVFLWALLGAGLAILATFGSLLWLQIRTPGKHRKRTLGDYYRTQEEDE